MSIRCSLTLQDETLGFMALPTGIGGLEMLIHGIIISKTLHEALQRKTTPIKQIAYMLGFSEPSAFSRAFKHWSGVSPGDYRKAAA